MTAILSGDIVHSRKLRDQDAWIKPLKKLLSTWGQSPQQWEISRGDYFQLEIATPNEALRSAFHIKALIKSIATSEKNKQISDIDVRIAIGLGSKDYEADRISESNGPAFVYSGEKLETLKKEKITLAVQTPWKEFDKEINLYLKLATLQMDKWSISSGELVKTILEFPDKTQAEIGRILNIEQNSVSGRWSRSNIDEILEVDRMFRQKLEKQFT